MKKLIIISIIITVLIFIFCPIIIFNAIEKVSTEVDNKTAEVKKFVGEKIVIDNDTLTIVDYSIIESSYTLSNGTKIAFDFAKKSLIK